MSRIDGARCLVTGGARGMGRGIAEALLSRGASVALLDIDQSGLDEATEALGRRGRVLSRVCDMQDVDAIYAAAEWAESDLGGVDILVNNAGVVSGGPLIDVTEEEHTRTWMVNALGVARMTRAVLPKMIRHGRGHVVNMGSASGLTGLALGTTYAASKWAVVGFSESLHSEMRHFGHPIVVTCVCPGYVDTGMFDGIKPPMLLPLLQPEKVVRATLTAIEEDQFLVTMPFIVGTVPLMRAVLPRRVLDVIAERLGVNKSMSGWRGH